MAGDLYDPNFAPPAFDPFGGAAPAGPSPFAQALQMARLNISEANLARQQAAAIDTHALKTIEYATKEADYAGQKEIRNKVENFPAVIRLKQQILETAQGKPLTDIEAAKFKVDQYKQFTSVLAGQKDFTSETVKLMLQQGDFQEQLKQLQKDQPGVFRSAGGVAGALIGGVISSVADTATGILAIAGVDRSNAIVQTTDAISKGASAAGNATGTKDQQKAQAAMSAALEAGDVTKMISAVFDAPGFILGQLAGGIIGPSGVAGVATKGVVALAKGAAGAKQLETMAKFSQRLSEIAKDGNIAQRLALGVASNTPVALTFGAAEAGSAVDDAEKALLKQKPDATEAEINQARRAAAMYAGGITGVGTLIAPGLEKAGGNIIGAFGKKTGDAVAAGLEAEAVKKGLIKGVLGKVPGVIGEATAQGIEEGLVAGAGAYGASQVTGQARTGIDVFNPANAVLGFGLGGLGKTAGNIGESVAHSRQATADAAAKGQADAEAKQLAATQQAQTDAAAQQTQQAQAQVQQAAATQQAAVTSAGTQAATTLLTTDFASPSQLAALRTGTTKLDSTNPTYTAALQKAVEAAYPDPAARTPQTEAIVKTAFDAKIAEAATPVVDTPQTTIAKVDSVEKIANALTQVDTVFKVTDPVRTQLASALTELQANKANLTADEVAASAQKLITDASVKVKEAKATQAVEAAIKGKTPETAPTAAAAPVDSAEKVALDKSKVTTAVAKGVAKLQSFGDFAAKQRNALTLRANSLRENAPGMTIQEVNAEANAIRTATETAINEAEAKKSLLGPIPTPPKPPVTEKSTTKPAGQTKEESAAAEATAGKEKLTTIASTIATDDVFTMRAAKAALTRLPTSVRETPEFFRTQAAIAKREAELAPPAPTPAQNTPAPAPAVLTMQEKVAADVEAIQAIKAELEAISPATPQASIIAALKAAKASLKELMSGRKKGKDSNPEKIPEYHVVLDSVSAALNREPAIKKIDGLLLEGGNKDPQRLSAIAAERNKIKAVGPDVAALDARINAFTNGVPIDSAAAGVDGKKSLPAFPPVSLLTTQQLRDELKQLETNSNGGVPGSESLAPLVGEVGQGQGQVVFDPAAAPAVPAELAANVASSLTPTNQTETAAFDPNNPDITDRTPLALATLATNANADINSPTGKKLDTDQTSASVNEVFDALGITREC